MHDWRALTKAQLDWNYDQRPHAPNMVQVLERLATAGAQAQARLSCRQRLTYGSTEIEALDWYACGQAQAPVLFFIHGGAWRSGQARDYAFFVEWMLAEGVDVVIPDFAAVQEVGGDLGVLHRQLAQALHLVSSRLQGSGRLIHLCGHSSGAHLAACLATSPGAVPGICSLTLCSGLYELEPVSLSSRSQYVNFTPACVEALSPQRHVQSLQRMPLPVTVLCGTQESPEFMRQSQAFHAALQAAALPSRLVMGEGMNHFDILESLAGPTGLLAKQLRKAWAADALA